MTSNIYNILYIEINAICLLITLFVILGSYKDLKSKVGRKVKILLASFMLSTFFDMVSIFFYGVESDVSYWMDNICNGLFFIFFILDGYFALDLTLARLNINLKKPLKLLIMSPALFGVVLSILSIFFDIFYNIIDFKYTRGTYYYVAVSIFYAYLVATIVLCFIKLLSIKSNKIDRRNEILFLIMMAIPIISSVLQNIFFGIPLLSPVGTFAILIIFLNGHGKYEKIDYLSNVYTKGEFENICRGINYAKKNLALIIFDLDQFKMINDLYGHKQGDVVLALTGRNLKKVFDHNAYIGRIGGDEFAVLIDGFTNLKDVADSVSLFLKKELKILKDISTLEISCSAGICFVGPTINDYSDFYEKADRALYRAKKDGGNRYSIYKLHEDIEAISKPYILMVDKDRLELAVLSSYFEDRYNIIEASCCEDVMNICKNIEVEFSSFIISYKQVKTSCAKAIKNINHFGALKNSKVLFITDNNIKLNKQSIKDTYGLNNYIGQLSKPFTPERIVKIVDDSIID